MRDFDIVAVSGKSQEADTRPANDNEWGVLKVSAVTKGIFRKNKNRPVGALPSSMNNCHCFRHRFDCPGSINNLPDKAPDCFEF